MVSYPYVFLLITFESIAGLCFTLFMNLMLLEVTPSIYLPEYMIILHTS